MAIKLKPLKDQVIVITGASSGIGLATARAAVKKGAKVVLASRNKGALDRICDELVKDGADAICVECDVADPQAVQEVADRAVREFGHIDSWVNTAGVSVYGKLWEVPLEEKRRLFETNFWGVVHGCRSALKVMRDSGGAIINIGSVLSERVVPLQGMYSATKHAVKAYTDSLRMEVEAAGFPVSITLIEPAAIMPPVYEPEVVANEILEFCAHPKREESSVATSAALHPLATSLIVTGLGLAAAAGLAYFGVNRKLGPAARRSEAEAYDNMVRH